MCAHKINPYAEVMEKKMLSRVTWGKLGLMTTHLMRSKLITPTM